MIYILLLITALSVLSLILSSIYFQKILNQMQCRMNILRNEIRDIENVLNRKVVTIKEQMLESINEVLLKEVAMKKSKKST